MTRRVPRRVPPGVEGYIRLSAARRISRDARVGDVIHLPRMTPLIAGTDRSNPTAVAFAPDRMLYVLSDEEFDRG